GYVFTQLAEPVVGRTPDGQVGAEVAAAGELAGGGGDGDPGPNGAGDLDGGRAHARSAGVDERPSPGREPALQYQRIPRGDEDLGNGGGGGRSDMQRYGHDLALVYDEALGVGAATDDAHHGVARLPVDGPGAGGRHPAGELEPGDLVCHGRTGVKAHPLENVGPVQRRRHDVDEHLL